MKILLIENGIVHEDVSHLFNDVSEAKESYNNDSLSFVETLDKDVKAGWGYKDGKFTIPEQTGCGYDIQTDRLIPHDQYRKILHERTSNDTLQAMRKIREGDTSYDWQGWLDKLDAYNRAVEETKNQPTYPSKVEYPEYPKK